MAGNAALILAGISGGGAAGNSLAWFAPPATALPTDTTTALIAAYKDAGWITENGLTKKMSETSKDVKGYGSFLPLRTIVTESKESFEIEFLETNLTTLSVYNRKVLTGAGALSATAGAVSFTTGPASMPSYVAVFDFVDGTNHVRAACPNVQVTNRGDMNVKNGEAIGYPVTLTAFPDTTGASIYWSYLVPALSA